MTIPEQAKPQIIKMRRAGMGWTDLKRWLTDTYGIDVHRSTIQRWYDREGYSETDFTLDEAAANMADIIAPESDDPLQDSAFWAEEKVKPTPKSEDKDKSED